MDKSRREFLKKSIFGIGTGIGIGILSKLNPVNALQNINFSNNSVQSSAYQGNKNLIINGDMKIAQRGTSFVTPANGAYTLDRWQQSYSSGPTYTVTQDSDVPSNEAFTNSLKIDVTTADASPIASDITFFWQSVEGLNWSKMRYGSSSARTGTLSFWLKSDTKTGTMCIAIRNNADDRTYVSEIVISDNNWNKYIVTIPGDTSGTWLTNNSIGCRIGFCFLAGSDYQISGSINSWLSETTKIASSNQDNFMDNVSNNIFLTGVQFEDGSQASSFEFRDFQSELLKCQRYYWRLTLDSSGYIGSSGTAVNSGNVALMIEHPVEMRVNPTMGYETTLSNYNIWDGASNVNPTGISTQSAGKKLHSLYFSRSGLTQFRYYNVSMNTSGWIDFDAEL